MLKAMNTHITEATQHGKTEIWEDIRDKRLEEWPATLNEIRMWRLFDALFIKPRQLRKLEEFVILATVTIEESRKADKELATQITAQHDNLPSIEMEEPTHTSDTLSPLG